MSNDAHAGDSSTTSPARAATRAAWMALAIVSAAVTSIPAQAPDCVPNGVDADPRPQRTRRRRQHVFDVVRAAQLDLREWADAVDVTVEPRHQPAVLHEHAVLEGVLAAEPQHVRARARCEAAGALVVGVEHRAVLLGLVHED